MFIYTNFYNAFKLSEIQRRAVERMINHFELRVENLEKIIVGVDDVNIELFVDTAERVLQSDVLSDLDTLKSYKLESEEQLATLKTTLETSNVTLEERITVIDEALKNLNNFDDSTLKESVRLLSDRMGALGIPEIKQNISALTALLEENKVDLSPLVNDINDLKEQVTGLTNYNDTEIKTRVDSLTTTVNSIDLAPLKTAIKDNELRLDGYDILNLDDRLAELSSQLNELEIPGGFDDSFLKMDIDTLNAAVEDIETQLNNMDGVAYDDSAVLTLISSIDTHVQELETRVNDLEISVIEMKNNTFRDDIDALTIRLDNLPQPEAYDDTLVRQELTFQKDLLQEFELRIEAVSEKGYDDTGIQQDILEMKAILEELSSGVDYDDTELRLRVTSLETTIEGLTIGDSQMEEALDTKQDKLLAGENIFIEADGLIHAVDTNTVYDDTALRNVVDQKQGRLTAGENVTLSGNTISAVDTIYDDSAVRTRLGSIQQILDEMVTGEISFQEFIDRLSTLETDMQLVKAKTVNLSANITSLQTIIDSIEDVDISEVNLALDSINQEIDQLRADLVDTTLEAQVSDLQTTVNGLIDTVNDLIENGGDAATIDPEALTDLQSQVDTLAENVSVISTDYNIRELISRVQDVESLTYHFEGTSQDVIDFIEDNSVRALRFHSIANLVDHATRTYHNATTINDFLKGEYERWYSNKSPGNITSSPVVFTYERATLNELGLLDQTIAIRINPSSGVLTADGKLTNNDAYMVVVLEGLINPDTGLTYTRQFTLGNNEIVDGQFNIHINPETTKLRIAFGALSDSGTPGLLPGKFVTDDTYIGLWKIDENTP